MRNLGTDHDQGKIGHVRSSLHGGTKRKQRKSRTNYQSVRQSTTHISRIYTVGS